MVIAALEVDEQPIEQPLLLCGNRCCALVLWGISWSGFGGGCFAVDSVNGFSLPVNGQSVNGWSRTVACVLHSSSRMRLVPYPALPHAYMRSKQKIHSTWGLHMGSPSWVLDLLQYVWCHFTTYLPPCPSGADAVLRLKNGKTNPSRLTFHPG